MFTVETYFYSQVAHLSLRQLGESADTMYLVDDRFRLRGYNTAFTRFAHQNGALELLRRHPLGSDILSAIADSQLVAFYRELFRRCLREHHSVHHRYECSSPDLFREYYQSIYPLPGGAGLLFTNHLIRTGDHPGPRRELSQIHLDEFGRIVQCGHCRKVRDHSSVDEKWDWVPSLLHQEPDNLSHHLCPACLDHYYPALAKEPDA